MGKHFKNTLQKLIHKCDIIGREPRLKLGHKDRNETVIGGLLCILLYSIMIICTLYFGQELLYKQVPIVIKSTIPSNENVTISITDNHFFFFFGFNDRQGNYIAIDPRYLDVKVKLIDATLTRITNETQIEIRKCNTTSLSDETKKLIAHLNVSYMYCINDNSIIFQRQGDILRYLSIAINKCNGAETDCKSPEEILEYTSNISLSLHKFNNIIDFRKHENFVTRVLETNHVYFSFGKRTKFEVMQNTIKTDMGFIIEDFQDDILYKVINYEVQNTGREDFSCIVDIVPSSLQKFYYRKYYKLQNLLAEVGGLARALVILAIFLNYFHDSSSYYEKLINKLFDVDDLCKYSQYEGINSIGEVKRRPRDSVILSTIKKENMQERQFEQESLNVHPSKSGNIGNLFLSSNIRTNKSTSLTGKKTPAIGKEAAYQTLPDEASGYSEFNTAKIPVPILRKNKSEGENKTAHGFFKEKIDTEQEPIKQGKNANLRNQVSNSTQLNNHGTHVGNPSNIYQSSNSLPAVNSKLPSTPESSESSVEEEEENLRNSYIKHLKTNEKIKIHFEKIKMNRFNITFKEMLIFSFCPRKGNTTRSKTLIGGVNRITTRTDLIYILKKNLEFDRFKNLLLKDYQLLLLNSLTKFMLDPEKVNLVEFDKCSYEKFIDCYEQASSGLNIVDRRLCRWVSPKFRFDFFN